MKLWLNVAGMHGLLRSAYSSSKPSENLPDEIPAPPWEHMRCPRLRMLQEQRQGLIDFSPNCSATRPLKTHPLRSILYMLKASALRAPRLSPSSRHLHSLLLPDCQWGQSSTKRQVSQQPPRISSFESFLNASILDTRSSMKKRSSAGTGHGNLRNDRASHYRLKRSGRNSS